MLVPPPNSWSTTPASRNTLFFAQAMRGFLDEGSFEGFRAYALDAVGRLKEVIDVASDVVQKRMREAALSSALHELAWSLSNDESAQDIAPNHSQIVVDLCRSQKPRPHDIILACQILLSKLEGKYPNTLIKMLMKTLDQDNKRTSLLSIISNMTSHFLNEGHDRNFLLENIDQNFFTKPMKRPSKRTVKAFLDKITMQPRCFVVLHIVSSTLEHIIRVDDRWSVVGLSELPAHAQLKVASWKGYNPTSSRFALITVEALDTHQATLKAFRLFEQAKSLNVLQVDQLDISWSEYSYVYTPRSNKGISLQTEQVLPGVQPVRILSGHRRREAEKLASRLQSSFDHQSRDRITRALSTAGSVMDNHQDEVRLISLWSSFEVLLGDPPDVESRISHFIKHLVPLIVVRYHRRLFVAVHDQLVVGYRKKFRQIMRAVQPAIESNRHTVFAKVMTLESFSTARGLIFSMCENNPLMLHRLWRLARHYGNPSAALKSLRAHAERVEWQLNRIYRTRNLLVHSGRSPPYTEPLVQNSLEYLRSSVMNIVRVGSLAGHNANLDQVIAEIGFEWEIARKRLEHQVHFDEKLAHALFRAL